MKKKKCIILNLVIIITNTYSSMAIISDISFKDFVRNCIDIKWKIS